jgi:phage terminase large subunit GpA-like protein
MPPIYDALCDYRREAVVCGSQMGKTGGLLNVIGRELDDAPAPILYVGPTKNNVSTVINPQVTAMLKSAPSLWAKTDRSRKSQGLSKTVAGVSLRLAWSGSPTELASQTAKYVLIDEYDRMDPIPGEGDAFALAEARNSNYSGGRGIATSTPTEGNVDVERHPETGIEHWKVADAKDVLSPIWRLWQEGTRFEWAVPCPHCSQYFIPRLRHLWWPKDADGKSCSPRVAKKEARLICSTNGCHIEDSAKAAMNAAGRYLAPGQKVVDGKVVGEPPDSDTASFWISGLCSPWKTFGDRAADYIRATNSGDQERIRVVINTGFGELYAFRGDAPPAAAVRKCAGPYNAGQLLAGARVLTCGVDVQKKRLVYAVRAWGYSMESWLIDYGELWGETEHAPVWEDLAELLERTYGDTEGKPGLPIRRMGIDSGYRPGDKWRRPDNLIYDFCLRYRRAVPTKGRDRLNKPLQPSLIDVTFRGQVHKKGLQLWHIDSDYFKSWVQGRIVWPEDQPGRFWVPQDVTEDYCMQLTAEARVPKPSGLATWVKIRAENHYLDCEAINVAMAQSLGVHRRRKPQAVDAKPAPGDAISDGPSDEPVPERVPAPSPRRQPFAPSRRRNWTTNW